MSLSSLEISASDMNLASRLASRSLTKRNPYSLSVSSKTSRQTSSIFNFIERNFDPFYLICNQLFYLLADASGNFQSKCNLNALSLVSCIELVNCSTAKWPIGSDLTQL